METNKDKLTYEELEKFVMGRSSVNETEKQTLPKYNENVEMNLDELLVSGFNDIIMESIEGDTHRWDVANIGAFFGHNMLCQIIEPFVTFNLEKTNWDLRFRLTYYGFGRIHQVPIELQLVPKDKVSLEAIGLNDYSIFITSSLVDMLTHHIIEYAKNTINNKESC